MALLVNRGEGRAVAAVVHHGYKALHDARKRWQDPGQLSSADVPVHVDEVAELQLELAGMRLPESV